MFRTIHIACNFIRYCIKSLQVLKKLSFHLPLLCCNLLHFSSFSFFTSLPFSLFFHKLKNSSPVSLVHWRRSPSLECRLAGSPDSSHDRILNKMTNILNVTSATFCSSNQIQFTAKKHFEWEMVECWNMYICESLILWKFFQADQFNCFDWPKIFRICQNISITQVISLILEKWSNYFESLKSSFFIIIIIIKL